MLGSWPEVHCITYCTRQGSGCAALATQLTQVLTVYKLYRLSLNLGRTEGPFKVWDTKRIEVWLLNLFEMSWFCRKTPMFCWSTGKDSTDFGRTVQDGSPGRRHHGWPCACSMRWELASSRSITHSWQEQYIVADICRVPIQHRRCCWVSGDADIGIVWTKHSSNNNNNSSTSNASAYIVTMCVSPGQTLFRATADTAINEFHFGHTFAYYTILYTARVFLVRKSGVWGGRLLARAIAPCCSQRLEVVSTSGQSVRIVCIPWKTSKDAAIHSAHWEK